MNESKESGTLVVGSSEGGAYFKPDGRNVSEPRGHLRFSRSVVISLAILLATCGLILTHDPVARGIENGVKSVANYVIKMDNRVVGYENQPPYPKEDLTAQVK